MISQSLTKLMAEAHATDLQRAARTTGSRTRRPRRRRSRARTVGIERAVAIRFAFPDDAQALARLAMLDSREPPRGEVLLCEVDGELWSALSLSDGTVVSDPFRPTAAVVELLCARAEQLRAGGGSQRAHWAISRPWHRQRLERGDAATG